MKNVLIVSYYYPPFNSVGAIRVSKFTQYLPEFDWRPIVLTADNDYPPTLPVPMPSSDVHRTRQWDVNRLPKLVMGGRQVSEAGYVTDASTLRGRILRTAGELYRQTLNFPDGQVGWYPFAVAEGMRIIGSEHPDVIYSSALPPTSHLVARRLAEKSGVPWVAEFRDLWTDNHNLQRNKALWRVERRLEQRILRSARAIVTVTEPWGALLHARFGKSVFVITNGFDPDDYPGDVRPTQRFTLTYTGILYGRNQDPRPLLQAIARLRERGLIDRESFELRMVGRYVEELRSEVIRHGIEDLVSVASSVSHRKALEMQLESTALVLLLWNGPEGEGWYPAKVFEYLGTGRPIVAIGPGYNAAAKLVESLDAGVVTETAEEVEKALTGWLDEFRATGQVRVDTDPERLKRFHRREVTATLARVLDLVSESRGPEGE